jgi:hypothetical protein
MVGTGNAPPNGGNRAWLQIGLTVGDATRIGTHAEVSSRGHSPMACRVRRFRLIRRAILASYSARVVRFYSKIAVGLTQALAPFPGAPAAGVFVGCPMGRESARSRETAWISCCRFLRLYVNSAN